MRRESEYLNSPVPASQTARLGLLVITLRSHLVGHQLVMGKSLLERTLTTLDLSLSETYCQEPKSTHLEFGNSLAESRGAR